MEVGTDLRNLSYFCKCNKGNGEKDENHICTLFLNKEQELLLYNKAQKYCNNNWHNLKYIEIE